MVCIVIRMNEIQYNQLATKEDIKEAIQEVLVVTKADLKDAIQEVLFVIRDLMEHIDTRFTALEKRMDAVEKRLDSIEERLDSIEGRLDAIEERLIIDRKDSANVHHWAHKVSKKVNIPFRTT